MADDRETDGWATANSEREREFTFSKTVGGGVTVHPTSPGKRPLERKNRVVISGDTAHHLSMCLGESSLATVARSARDRMPPRSLLEAFPRFLAIVCTAARLLVPTHQSFALFRIGPHINAPDRQIRH